MLLNSRCFSPRITHKGDYCCGETQFIQGLVHHSKYASLLPILALTLLLPLACAAESTPAPAPTPTPPEVQSVEIQGSRFDARREDTASKTVIGREEILRFGDPNLNDVLKRLPGITIVNGGIRLRGLGNGFTQILLNGEPAPP